MAPFYLIWLFSLGAIGAVAYIGMNALSIQEDITFDLTNPRLMILRIVLGGLFGLVLTLPFGYQDFLNFCVSLIKANPVPAEQPEGNKSAWQAVTLLMPFVLGFSTSLVLLVLNQMVDGFQAFFGKGSIAAKANVAARAETRGLSPHGSKISEDEPAEFRTHRAGNLSHRPPGAAQRERFAVHVDTARLLAKRSSRQ